MNFLLLTLIRRHVSKIMNLFNLNKILFITSFNLDYRYKHNKSKIEESL